MKILLINTPSPFLLDQKSFPPLGLLCLAVHLRENAPLHEVRVLDLAGREDDLAAALEGAQADLFGVTATTPQYAQAKRVLALLRRRCPRAKIILGGVHATSMPEVVEKDGWDHVILREGEGALLELVRKIAVGESSPVRIAGSYIPALDALPFPAYDLLDLGEYGYKIDGHLAMTLMTSRGCPFQCAFCSKEVWSGSVRFYSPEYVERLARRLMERHGFRHLLFLDDAITLGKPRLLEICRRIEPLGIRWRCYAHVNTCDREMLQAMKRAGCIEIGVGIESGSQKILDAVCKGTRVEKNAEFIRMCREEGIASNAFLMIGLPGESPETVAETRAWMEKARPDKFGYNIFLPYAGTPVYQHPERYDIRLFPVDDERAWVKGRPGEYSCFVETSRLSRAEILKLFAENFDYFMELTRWRPGYNERLDG